MHLASMGNASCLLVLHAFLSLHLVVQGICSTLCGLLVPAGEPIRDSQADTAPRSVSPSSSGASRLSVLWVAVLNRSELSSVCPSCLIDHFKFRLVNSSKSPTMASLYYVAIVVVLLHHMGRLQEFRPPFDNYIVLASYRAVPGSDLTWCQILTATCISSSVDG